MSTFLGASLALMLAASAATYVQYQSFDPCQWMEQDLASQGGLTHLAAKARVRGQFLIRGIAEPDAGQCVMAWWEFRADNPSGGS